MNIVFYLSTCSTCLRILKELNLPDSFKLQDIKTEKITESQIDFLAKKTGSYEAFFSRKAMKYRALGFRDKKLNENDYKKLILEEYTFLKRPVIVINDAVFAGNSKAVVAEAKKKL